MNRTAALALIVILSVCLSACSPYRVVSLGRGVDQDGKIQEFYAVAHNNVIVPEYVVNERGEYPTDEKTAWERFEARKDEWVPKMKGKYRIPGDAARSAKQTSLGAAFLAAFPVSYPVYLLASKKGDRSVGDYFDLMVNGSKADLPEVKDEFANF